MKPFTQVVLQCKVMSIQPPTVKWFRKRDNDQQPLIFDKGDTRFSQPIKFFENFYEPLTLTGSNMGSRSSDNTFSSKLILNDVDRSSVYVCIAINYHGVSYREFFIAIDNEALDDEQQYSELLELPERNYEILFVIPLIILIFISVILSTILYLMIQNKVIKSRNIKCYS